MIKNLIYFSLLILLFSCKKNDFFDWNKIGAPEVGHIQANSNNLLKFVLSANFISNGYDKDAKIGFIISKNNSNPNFILNDSIIYLNENKIGYRQIELFWTNTSGLYCKAFSINKIDTAYSQSLLISWPGNSSNLPKVETIIPTEIEFYHATCGSLVINDGGIPLKRFGVLISTNNQPNITNSTYILESTSSNQVLEIINNLNDNTLYFARGFAENLAGLTYADSIYSFHTKRFYEIGEQGPAGGIIFYNKLDNIGGWNFMECHFSEINIMLPWSINSNLQTNLQTQIGTGLSNTQNIVNVFGQSGSNYAANYCYSFNYNGYSNWFLPSRDELTLIYKNLMLVGLGGFQNGQKYWSSSNDEYFGQNAWCQQMQNNSVLVNPNSENKTTVHKFRPVRCF